MTKPVYQCIDVHLNLLYLYKHAVYCTVNVFYFTSTIVHYIFANRHLFNKITLQAINKADLFFSSFFFDLSFIIKFKIQFVTILLGRDWYRKRYNLSCANFTNFQLHVRNWLATIIVTSLFVTNAILSRGISLMYIYVKIVHILENG